MENIGDITALQIILLTLLAGYAQYDGLHALTGMVKPVMIGLFTGLIMGDVETGLYVGGTINLMKLGVGNFGGASIPDYMSATMLGTVFAITSGQGAEFGVTLAIPIAVLLINMDILARFSNVYLLKRAQKSYEKRDYDKIIFWNNFGIVFWSLSRMIPVFIGLVLGPDVVDAIINYLPQVILDGMKTAGGIIPAIGLAMLLRYMPVKENIAYLLFGFVLSAYLGIPILGIAIIATGCALLVFKNDEALLAAKGAEVAIQTEDGFIGGDE